MHICNEVVKAIILESKYAQEFFFCDQIVMRYVSLTQKYGLEINGFCHDWELAIVFTTKLCKLKMRTLLTSVQIHRRKCLEKKSIISISRLTR